MFQRWTPICDFFSNKNLFIGVPFHANYSVQRSYKSKGTRRTWPANRQKPTENQPKSRRVSSLILIQSRLWNNMRCMFSCRRNKDQSNKDPKRYPTIKRYTIYVVYRCLNERTIIVTVSIHGNHYCHGKKTRYRGSLFPLKDLRVTSESGRSRGWTRSRDSSILRHSGDCARRYSYPRRFNRNSICVTSAAERTPVTSMQTSWWCVNKCVAACSATSVYTESYDLPVPRTTVFGRDRRKANSLVCSSCNRVDVVRSTSPKKR